MRRAAQSGRYDLVRITQIALGFTSCGGPLKAVVMTFQVTDVVLYFLMRRAAQSGRYDLQ